LKDISWNNDKWFNYAGQAPQVDGRRPIDKAIIFSHYFGTKFKPKEK
jgi:hypothetical protein